MSYLSQDEQILIKIQKYMGMLKRLYSSIEYLSNDELKKVAAHSRDFSCE